MEHCDAVKIMWQNYLDSLPAEAPQPEIYITWHFADSENSANLLARQALAGTKTATTSLLWEYEADEEDLPQPGDLSIITDWEGQPVCIIETTGIEVQPFGQVSPEHAARDMAGDPSLDHWREAHWQAFARACAALERPPQNDMPVVCERFRLVYPRPAGGADH